MPLHHKLMIIGIAFWSMFHQVHAAPQGEGKVKLTMLLTNTTISVNATNMTAKVVIENTTKDAIKFYFNSFHLIGTDFQSIEFVLPASGKVRARPRNFLPSIELQLITIEPGEKYVGDVNLSQFIEIIDEGEFEVGLKANLKYYRKDEQIGKGVIRTMTGQTTITLEAKK